MSFVRMEPFLFRWPNGLIVVLVRCDRGVCEFFHKSCGRFMNIGAYMSWQSHI